MMNTHTHTHTRARARARTHKNKQTNNYLSFYPLSLPAELFVPIALTPITADRYVIANSHYGRACVEKPGPSHNTDTRVVRKEIFEALPSFRVST